MKWIKHFDDVFSPYFVKTNFFTVNPNFQLHKVKSFHAQGIDLSIDNILWRISHQMMNFDWRGRKKKRIKNLPARDAHVAEWRWTRKLQWELCHLFVPFLSCSITSYPTHPQQLMDFIPVKMGWLEGRRYKRRPGRFFGRFYWALRTSPLWCVFQDMRQRQDRIVC